jgi:hypothetical protein
MIAGYARRDGYDARQELAGRSLVASNAVNPISQPSDVSSVPGVPPLGGVGNTPGRNVLAVVALVLSVCGGIAPATIMAIIALVQIRRSGQRGRVMAIVSLVLSLMWTVAAGTVLVVLLKAAGVSRDASGHIDRTSTVNVDRLRAGDCILAFDKTRANANVQAVPCDQPHHAEVFAVFTLDSGSYPGEQKAGDLAIQGCSQRARWRSRPDLDTDALHTFAFYPGRMSWATGDRSVRCLVYDPDHTRVGSIAG